MTHPNGFHERAPRRIVRPHRRVRLAHPHLQHPHLIIDVDAMYRVLKGPARERVKMTFLGQRYGASPETVMRMFLQQSVQRIVR